MQNEMQLKKMQKLRKKKKRSRRITSKKRVVVLDVFVQKGGFGTTEQPTVENEKRWVWEEMRQRGTKERKREGEKRWRRRRKRSKGEEHQKQERKENRKERKEKTRRDGGGPYLSLFWLHPKPSYAFARALALSSVQSEDVRDREELARQTWFPMCECACE